MVPNPFSMSLTHKSPLFCRLFSSSSIPSSNFSQRSQLSLNPVQISGFKACSYPIRCSNGRIEFKGLGCFDLGWPENAGRICAATGSGGGSGSAGGLGGSGGGNSGGGGETDGGSSGGIDWSFLSWFFTPAILNCIWDLIRQLVFEQASSVDLKRTAVAGSMGLPLVGRTLRFWSLEEHGMSAFSREMANIFLAMAIDFLFVLLCCIQILVLAYNFTMRNRALEDDIKSLSKYKYSHENRLIPMDDDEKNQVLIGSNELSLLPDDLDCCICLSSYAEGEELNVLPCKHHFHCECIGKWLRINATCPICKYSIRRGDNLPDSNSNDSLNINISHTLTDIPQISS